MFIARNIIEFYIIWFENIVKCKQKQVKTKNKINLTVSLDQAKIKLFKLVVVLSFQIKAKKIACFDRIKVEITNYTQSVGLKKLSNTH